MKEEGTITFYEAKDGEILNHGTFERIGGLDHEGRVAQAKECGVPDSWTHCKLNHPIKEHSGTGHYHDGKTSPEGEYWINVDEDGKVLGYVVAG